MVAFIHDHVPIVTYVVGLPQGSFDIHGTRPSSMIPQNV